MWEKQTIIVNNWKMWLQDRKFKSESIWSLAYNIAKEKFPLHKIKIINNTMKKNNFRYHITMIKVNQHALIYPML